MAESRTQAITSQYDRRGWVLIALFILVVLAFAFTLPSLYVAVVRSGFLGERAPAVDGWILLVGLLGLTVVFCLYMIRQQAQINQFRRRLIADQMELEQSRGRLGEVISLFQLGGNLQMELPLETVAEITVRRLAATFRANEAVMFLYDPASKTLKPSATFGVVPRGPDADVPLGEGPVGWVARHGEAILMSASEKGARFADYFATRPDVGSALFLPLMAGNRCVAVVSVSRGPKAEPFRLEHRDIGQVFAGSIAAVLERSLVQAQLHENAAEAARPKEGAETPAAGFKDAFLSSAAIELRAPITSVVAYAEVIDQNDQRMTPSMRREFTGRLRGEAQRLALLVDDVLDVVRLEMGRYLVDLRQGNVNAVARAAADLVRGPASSKGVDLELHLDEKIPDQLLDAGKLRQALLRLLQNGVRFSPAKGRVVLATWLGDDHVLIEIRDSGPQIEPEDAAQVFELETAAEGRSKRCKDGMGLGLHLTKRFVELHGGQVGVGPGPTGAGVTFWIRLPRGEAQAGVFGLKDPFAEETSSH